MAGDRHDRARGVLRHRADPQHLGWGAAIAACGVVMPAAGIVAALVTTVAKWVLVGRFKESSHPLWSSFVWRNELFDVFYEVVGVPLFAGAFLGTPVFNVWARTLGVKIGKWVWLESHWLPETDLINLGDGVTINRGCVLQTHLFHDRLMRISPVHMGAGSSLGPKSISLPGTSIGAGARIGAGSLVMRGEHVPAGTRWTGNPIVAVDAARAPQRTACCGGYGRAPEAHPTSVGVTPGALTRHRALQSVTGRTRAATQETG